MPRDPSFGRFSFPIQVSSSFCFLLIVIVIESGYARLFSIAEGVRSICCSAITALTQRSA